MKDEPRLIKNKVVLDERGCFSEVFDRKDFPHISFKIQNHSISLQYVFRGFHAQIPAQNKLVRCVSGKILDFVFNPHTGELHEFALNNPFDWVFVPKTMLHGFLALEHSQVHYLVDKPYNSQTQIVLPYNSPEIEFDLNCHELIVSERDKSFSHSLSEIKDLLKIKTSKKTV